MGINSKDQGSEGVSLTPGSIAGMSEAMPSGNLSLDPAPELERVAPIPEPAEPDSLMSRLQAILKDWLAQNPRRSLNGLSKRCTVSEPTLRRILKGQIKTLPNVTTVLDVLTTITGEKSSRKIAEMFPGPIASYINEMSPHLEDCDVDYDPTLNVELRNPTTYIIYKLASNNSGVLKNKVLELFGAQGLFYLDNLEKKGYVAEKDGAFFATSQNFSGNHGDFVTNFKAVADFLKTRISNAKPNLNPLLVNYSESISGEAYKEIVAVQKLALKKIRMILSDPASAGTLPVVMLMGLDTLDPKTAAEIVEESE